MQLKTNQDTHLDQADKWTLFTDLNPHTLVSRKPRRAVFLPAFGLENVLAKFAQILDGRSTGVDQVTLAVLLVCLFAGWFHTAADILDLGEPEAVFRSQIGTQVWPVHNVTLAVEVHFVRMLPVKGGGATLNHM